MSHHYRQQCHHVGKLCVACVKSRSYCPYLAGGHCCLLSAAPGQNAILPAYIYMYTSPPIADNAIHPVAGPLSRNTTPGLFAQTPSPPPKTPPHEPPELPPPEQIPPLVVAPTRVAPIPAYSPMFFSYSPLIQSPHTIPSLISSQHATWGRADPQVQNAARQLLHHHTVMPRREKRSRPRAKSKSNGKTERTKGK